MSVVTPTSPSLRNTDFSRFFSKEEYQLKLVLQDGESGIAVFRNTDFSRFLPEDKPAKAGVTGGDKAGGTTGRRGYFTDRGQAVKALLSWEETLFFAEHFLAHYSFLALEIPAFEVGQKILGLMKLSINPAVGHFHWFLL